MKNKLLLILLLLTVCLTTGCAKGEIMLDLSRNGQAKLHTKVLVLPLIKESLKELKDKFAQDKFAVMDIKEGSLEGFIASRQFASVKDIKEVSVFKKITVPYKTQTPPPTIGTAPPNPAPPLPGGFEGQMRDPKLTVEKGLLLDTYKIDAIVDLRTQDKISVKEETWLIRSILSQISLKFILKLPTAVERSNAVKVSEDGRELTWDLVLGEENQIVAEVQMINFVNVGIIIAVLSTVGFVIYKKRKKIA